MDINTLNQTSSVHCYTNEEIYIKRDDPMYQFYYRSHVRLAEVSHNGIKFKSNTETQ